MLKWTMRANITGLGAKTPEIFRKHVNSLSKDESKSEGYLTEDSRTDDDTDDDFEDVFGDEDSLEMVLPDSEDGNNNNLKDLNQPGSIKKLSKFKCGFIRGSDPLIQTARSKQQNRRCKLNAQINREMRLRAGAENLYKATNNAKLKESVAMELRLVNSNLQLLKEDLAQINDSVLLYQSNSSSHRIPMIPLGLKETNDVNIDVVMRRFIPEHYWEDPALYEDSILKFTNIRQASRTPLRNEEGIELLFRYFNHLYFIDKRFFASNKGHGILFEWYDSITGVPSSQTTLGYEKGAVLFNIAALYTQIGARQERTTADGLMQAVVCFQKASGCLRFLLHNFTNSPSTDMQPATLTMLMALLLAQASECQLELYLMKHVTNTLCSNMDFAHEATMVSNLYFETHGLMTSSTVQDYVPFSWISMVEVKYHYYQALAHYHVAVAVLDQSDSSCVKTLADCFSGLHVHEVRVGSIKKVASGNESSTPLQMRPPRTVEQRQTFARAHLRQSILANEDALRKHGISRQQRKIDTFQDVLKAAHNRSLKKFSELEDEDDFTELLSAPRIKAHSSQILEHIDPDFTIYKVDDLFHDLGPLAIFSACHEWSKPQRVEMKRAEGEEYGFSVRGDSPVIIAEVVKQSLAERCSVKVGDFIVGVGEETMKWCRHEEVVSFIKAAGNHLILTLVTPLDRNYLSPVPPEEINGGHAQTNGTTTMQTSVVEGPTSYKQRSGERRRSSSSLLPWKIRHKGSGKEGKKGGKNVLEGGQVGCDTWSRNDD